MAGSTTCEIRFIGGPMDGHRETRPREDVGLVELIHLPVDTNSPTARAVGHREPAATATGVAVYELGILDGVASYRFVGPNSARQSRLEQWLG